jgi:hypothetical protein
MAVGDQYRAKALEVLAHAETENDLAMRRDLEMMAVAYLRLAEQAERNQNFVVEAERTGKESDPEPEP